MQQPSRTVTSRQTAPHKALPGLLQRRTRQAYGKPLHPASTAAFRLAETWLREQQQPLILDAGCGTGESTRELASLYPDFAVVGIDKSAHRLSREYSGATPANCLLVRADLVDFWRLAAAAGWQPQRHYLLYPNPWPKPKHLHRRWHAHPVMPWLLALGGQLEVRSNWPVYAQEFAYTLSVLLQRPIAARPLQVTAPMSPFERKYRASDHALYACSADITPTECGHWLSVTSTLAAGSHMATLQPASQTAAKPADPVLTV